MNPKGFVVHIPLSGLGFRVIRAPKSRFLSGISRILVSHPAPPPKKKDAKTNTHTHTHIYIYIYVHTHTYIYI